MRYRDMVIEAAGLHAARQGDGQRLVQFSVRVLASPAGDMRPEEAVPVEYVEDDLQAAVQGLRLRTLARSEVEGLGRTLGLLLLPPAPAAGAPGVRELLIAALAQLGEGEGLRLRLRLPAELDALPWELALVERSGGGVALGFLALDPRVALVRYEELAVAAVSVAPAGRITIVAALASPAGLPPLRLDVERAAIEQALAGAAGLAVVFVQPATLDAVQQALPGAAIFHFAGHGLAQGAGALALEEGRLEAETLAVNLRSAGVRLALLGACDTGRREAGSPWGGIAATLVRAGLPAVVAYQMTIDDAAASAFSKHFYTALVSGMPIERAMAAGRIAAYNFSPAGREWATPVLYLRAADGQLFAGSADAGTRDEAAKTVNLVINERFGAIGASTVVGAKIGKVSMKGAHILNVNTSIAADSTGDDAQITGVEIGEI
jgi:hypothetical protein